MKYSTMKVFLAFTLIIINNTTISAESSENQMYDYEQCYGEHTVETYAGNLKIKTSFLKNLTTGKIYPSWSGTLQKKPNYPNASFSNNGAIHLYSRIIKAKYIIRDGFGNVISGDYDIPVSGSCTYYSFPGEPLKLPIEI